MLRGGDGLQVNTLLQRGVNELLDPDDRPRHPVGRGTGFHRRRHSNGPRELVESNCPRPPQGFELELRPLQGEADLEGIGLQGPPGFVPGFDLGETSIEALLKKPGADDLRLEVEHLQVGAGAFGRQILLGSERSEPQCFSLGATRGVGVEVARWCKQGLRKLQTQGSDTPTLLALGGCLVMAAVLGLLGISLWPEGGLTPTPQ